MKQVIVLVVKYHGATATQGSRLSIKNTRNGLRRTYSYDCIHRDVMEQAVSILKTNNIPVESYASNEVTKEFYLMINWVDSVLVQSFFSKRK